MKRQPPFGSSDPNAPYVDRNTVGAVKGSQVPAKAIDQPQTELDYLISTCGLTPSDADLQQVAKAIQSGKLNYVAAGGTVNAITASITPAPASLTVGLEVNVKLAGPTTGTMTFNLNGLGAQAVVLPDGSAVQTGIGTAGMLVTFKWDGTNWQLWLPLSPQVLNAQVAPAIRVNKTTDQSMSVNVETICTFNSVAFNDLGSLATWNGTDTLTIGASGAGKWLIVGVAGCYQSNSSGAAANRIKVSGVKVAEAYSIINSVAGAQAGPLSVIYKLAAGDTIQIAGYVTSGSTGQAMYAAQLPFFSAVFLGK